MSAVEKPMTLDGAADALGCSRRWLQGWLSSHPDHGYKIGREWRFLPEDIITIREALRCRSSSSETARTQMMVSGTSGGLSADAALKKALALATKSGRKSSKPGGKLSFSMRQSMDAPPSQRSHTPARATLSVVAKDGS